MNKYFATRSINRPWNIGDTRTLIYCDNNRESIAIEWDEDILFYNGPWSLEEVRSEITCLNTMLQLLVNVGCMEYWPGWGMKYSTAAETRKAIMTNVERLYTYYKETYQEDEGDD